MYKLVISFIIAILLAGIQYYFDTQGDVPEKKQTNFPIKSLMVFTSVFAITYMGQKLIFDGGIGNNDENNILSQTFLKSNNVSNNKELNELMQNIQTGEAPF
jgi:hypothetical protein